MKRGNNWNLVFENDDITVEQDEFGNYRVSYFIDYHYQDSVIFTPDETVYS